MSIIVENTQGHGNTSSEADLVTEERFIQVENSKLGETQRQLSIFKEGVLKLKQYYDMQMLVMKSHLHGEHEESIETFFGKLIKIMEFVKQMFLYLDSACVGHHGDNSKEQCETDQPRSSSQDATQNGYDNSNAINSFHHQQQNVLLDDISSTVEVTEHLPQISTSILSPQFDAMYTAIHDHDDHHHHQQQQQQQQRCSYQRYTSEELNPQTPAGTSNSTDLHALHPHIGPPRVSTDETCNVCKNTFTTKRDLHRHMRRHTGEKPFRCEVCTKDFSRKDFLLKHKLTHTGEKPHCCSQCHKRFSQRSNLNKHMLTHTKIHRFTCKMCRRGFHQMINVHRHEQLHCNTNKHFQCTWCSKVQYQGADCLKTFLDKRDANTE